MSSTPTGPQHPPGHDDPRLPSITPAFLWIVVAAIASAFVAIWGVQVVGQRRERILEARVDSLRALLASSEKRTAGETARSLRSDTEAGTRTARNLIEEDEIEGLRHQGLADPVNELEADLMKHPELIPFPGVEGGRMGFYSPDNIRILGGHYAFARFEDGHVGGTILLEYKVERGRIAWRRLAALMD